MLLVDRTKCSSTLDRSIHQIHQTVDQVKRDEIRMREKKKKKNRKGEAIILSRFPMNPREDWSLRKEKKGGKIYIYMCVCMCAIKNMVLCVFCSRLKNKKGGGKMLTRKKQRGEQAFVGRERDLWPRSVIISCVFDHVSTVKR